MSTLDKVSKYKLYFSPYNDPEYRNIELAKRSYIEAETFNCPHLNTELRIEEIDAYWSPANVYFEYEENGYVLIDETNNGIIKAEFLIKDVLFRKKIRIYYDNRGIWKIHRDHLDEVECKRGNLIHFTKENLVEEIITIVKGLNLSAIINKIIIFPALLKDEHEQMRTSFVSY